MLQVPLSTAEKAWYPVDDFKQNAADDGTMTMKTDYKVDKAMREYLQ